MEDGTNELAIEKTCSWCGNLYYGIYCPDCGTHYQNPEIWYCKDCSVTNNTEECSICHKLRKPKIGIDNTKNIYLEFNLLKDNILSYEIDITEDYSRLKIVDEDDEIIKEEVLTNEQVEDLRKLLLKENIVEWNKLKFTNPEIFMNATFSLELQTDNLWIMCQGNNTLPENYLSFKKKLLKIIEE